MFFRNKSCQENIASIFAGIPGSFFFVLSTYCTECGAHICDNLPENINQYKECGSLKELLITVFEDPHFELVKGEQ